MAVKRLIGISASLSHHESKAQSLWAEAVPCRTGLFEEADHGDMARRSATNGRPSDVEAYLRGCMMHMVAQHLPV